MNTIYKYELEVIDIQEVELPEDCKILSVQVQRGKVYLWALINIVRPLSKRTFRMYGTGHRIEFDVVDKLNYISTFQLQNGLFVFHVFEQV